MNDIEKELIIVLGGVLSEDLPISDALGFIKANYLPKSEAIAKSEVRKAIEENTKVEPRSFQFDLRYIICSDLLKALNLEER